MPVVANYDSQLASYS